MRIHLVLLRRIILLAFVTLVLLGAGGSAAAAVTVTWQSPLTPLTVTRPFEQPPTPYAAGHRGVDLAGRPGQQVRAAAAGSISYAGKLAGRGVVVVVHGALRTTYEPVLATVHRGALVVGGQEIGTLAAGHLGCPAPACLHWGLLRGEVYLDPMSLLLARQVRLLPPAGFGTVRSGAVESGAVESGAVEGEAVKTGAVAGSAASDGLAATGRSAPAPSIRATKVNGTSGPSSATWALVAVSGAGALVAFRRRR